MEQANLLAKLAPVKRCVGLLAGALLLLCADNAFAVSFSVGLNIAHDLDGNGNMTVLNGSKLRVEFEVTDPDQSLNRKDKIQLVRVAGDEVVSSVGRGKKASGAVLLLVKKSENEALYVRYIRNGEAEVIATASHPESENYIPLRSIPKADLKDLTIRVNALENAQSKVYKIGDVGPAGGWVFYITPGSDGLHGLEAAPEDSASLRPWGCAGTSLRGAGGLAVGNGGQNTGDILSGCLEANIPARIAANYWVNGYSDWYLPSSEELNLMYLNIGQGSTTIGNVGGFEPWFYWSSSEQNDSLAWDQFFEDSTIAATSKTFNDYVRAIRNF